jgi:hypothetical protein
MKKKTFDSCSKDTTEWGKSATPEHTFRYSGIERCNPEALPCASCGSTERKLGAGKAPGEASLRCECGKFIKWLSASQTKAIAARLRIRNGGQR